MLKMTSKSKRNYRMEKIVKSMTHNAINKTFFASNLLIKLLNLFFIQDM